MAQKGKCWARFPSGLSETDGSKDTAVVFVVYCLPASKLSFCHQSDKQTNKQTKTLLHSSRQHHAVVKMKMMTCICPFIVWFMDGDWTTVWWMFQSSGPTCDSTRQFILTVLFKLQLEFSHYYFLLEQFFLSPKHYSSNISTTESVSHQVLWMLSRFRSSLTDNTSAGMMG